MGRRPPGSQQNKSPHRKRLLGAITQTARRERLAPGLRPPWDSNHCDVDIINIVRCMAYKIREGSREGSYMLCSSRAIVWAIQGGGRFKLVNGEKTAPLRVNSPVIAALSPSSPATVGLTRSGLESPGPSPVSATLSPSSPATVG